MIQRITTYKSNKGSSRVVHHIHGEPTSGSYADYILLIEDYKTRDLEYIVENMGWQIKLFYHFNFLLKRQHECEGNLTCVFCGEEHLKIQPVGYFIPKKEMATVDHFKAQSKGGDKLNEWNMVVACSKCNGNKGSKDYPIESIKFMDEERFIQFKKRWQKETA